MAEIESLRIINLSPDTLEDFLNFFDQKAFADNPEWSFCYCYFNQFPHDDQIWKKQEGSANRKAVCSLINQGKMNGHLAYLDGQVVGWCNAGPRTSFTTVPEYIEPDEEIIGSIMCFIIRKEYRRCGIARRLLKAACMSFQEKGFKIIEAYPLNEVNGEKENHFGPLSLYLSSGFEEYREDDGAMVVRKVINHRL